MSKMDNLRAMREARYAEAQKRAATTPAKPARPPVAPPASKRKPELVVVPDGGLPPADVEAEAETEELCGHRNMGGRTCTREAGHSAKSHRYS